MQEKSDLDKLLETGSSDEMQSFVNLLSKDDQVELLHQLSIPQWKQFVNYFHASDVAELLASLPKEKWQPLIRQLSPEKLADVLAELEDPEIRRALDHINLKDLPELLSDMETDDATDILKEMPSFQAFQVLAKMDEKEALPLKQLLKYPEDSAGGLMQTELVTVPINFTVLEAIYDVQHQVKEVHNGDLDIYSFFVVDDHGKFEGQISLEKIILASAEEPIRDLLDYEEKFWVHPEMDQEEVADYFQKYNLVAIPVIDHKHRLLGRITVDDIVDVIEEEATEDILQMAGAEGENLVYDETIRSAFLRLPWLISNLIGGLITGYLTLKMKVDFKGAGLIAFIPVIMGMGGNVGTQSSSITVRGFAIGRIDLQNIRRFFWKEMRVGALMGVTCGIVLSLIGGIWFQNPKIGLVVGLSLFFGMTIAASMGSLFPAVFQRLGVDPALASGPFVTTFNDIMGVLVYYFIAFLFIAFLI